jgi:imidazolonepropionase-like amidohydrolase
MKFLAACLLLLAALAPASSAQTPLAKGAVLIRPARVFDGTDPRPHEGWQVLVQDGRIAAAGPNLRAPQDVRIIEIPGATLMPGLIEGHGHLFLHAYNETSWDDQVLHEPLALRTARAVAHARATLMAGFTSERDLGTEGAGYADVGLKQAIDQGIIPGPRMVVATRAIVAKGAYGPKGYEPGVEIPQGAEEASGVDDVVRAVRSQIAAGADVVKLYGDYRWRPGEDSRPTFSTAEMKAAVDAAHDAGRPVAVHASTPEGMRRAIAAGADTIEHGYGGTAEIFRSMKEKGVFLCPTLAATDATSRYRGWNGQDPAPASVASGLKAFALARAPPALRCAPAAMSASSRTAKTPERWS